MSKEIFLESRYGNKHRLVPVEELGENIYRYTPAKDWMPIYASYVSFDNSKDENDLTSVDTDGGPFLGIGYTVGDGRKVVRIYEKKNYGTLIQLR